MAANRAARLYVDAHRHPAYRYAHACANLHRYARAYRRIHPCAHTRCAQ